MQKTATIRDIAKMAGVSIATVSRAFTKDSVIKPETREKILELSKQYGYKPSNAAARLTKKSIKIGILMLTHVPEYADELQAGCEAAYHELVDYKIVYSMICLKDCSQALGAIRKLEKTGIQGLIICLPDYTEAVINKLNEMINNGVVVATLTHDCTEIKRIFTSRNNTKVSGNIAAELLGSFVKGNKIVLFTGGANVSLHRNIIRSFQEEAGKRGLETVGIYDTQDNNEIAKKCIDKALEEHPDINGIYITSMTSIPIINEVIARNKQDDITIIASDLFPEMADFIKKGAVKATIFQDPFKQAKSAFENLYYYIAENAEIPGELVIIPQIIIKSNIDLYIQQSVLFSSY